MYQLVIILLSYYINIWGAVLSSILLQAWLIDCYLNLWIVRGAYGKRERESISGYLAFHVLEVILIITDLLLEDLQCTMVETVLSSHIAAIFHICMQPFNAMHPDYSISPL